MSRLHALLACLILACAAPLGGAFAQEIVLEPRYGTTVLTAPPERVVTVGLVEQDAVLALGVVPVGTTEWIDADRPGALWPWAQEKLADLGGEVPVIVGDASAVDLERVLSLEPDLILALYSDLSAEEYTQLSRIAPTVAQPVGERDWGVSWQTLTRTVGQALGRVEEAERVVAEVEAQVAAVREEHPEFVGATALVATPYQGVYLYGPEDLRGRLLQELSFALPEELASIAGESFGGNLSPERYDLLETNVLVWLEMCRRQEQTTHALCDGGDSDRAATKVAAQREVDVPSLVRPHERANVMRQSSRLSP